MARGPAWRRVQQKTHDALNHWSATEMRWNKNAVSLASPVAELNRRSTLVRKSKARSYWPQRFEHDWYKKKALGETRILGLLPRDGKVCSASNRMTWGVEVRLSKRTDHCDVPCHGLASLPRARVGHRDACHPVWSECQILKIIILLLLCINNNNIHFKNATIYEQSSRDAGSNSIKSNRKKKLP